MADISKITLPTGDTYDIKDETARNTKADLASPTFTGTPKAPTAAVGTNTTQIATTEFVMNAFQANDAMLFKGTIGTGGTVTTLPDTHYQGWTYKVATAGEYAGKQCEIGDMIICVVDGTAANNDDWAVVQSNIDGAVTGPASSVNGNIAVFNGTTGKIIKDGGVAVSALSKATNWTNGNSVGSVRTIGGVVEDSSYTMGMYATAEGWNTKASGLRTHAEGSGTTASGPISHAEGASTVASGQSSHAEGSNTTASGVSSHAEGYDNEAQGDYSHTEGCETITDAMYAHAEGYATQASGDASHAEGQSTRALGHYSHAEGLYTEAHHKSQHVFGEYNIVDANTNSVTARGTYVEIVGNGTGTSARSNARILDWSGNEVLSGSMTVNNAVTLQFNTTTNALDFIFV